MGQASRRSTPRKRLARIRGALGLFANLRPSVIFGPLKSASPIKDDIIGGNLDIMIVASLRAVSTLEKEAERPLTATRLPGTQRCTRFPRLKELQELHLTLL